MPCYINGQAVPGNPQTCSVMGGQWMGPPPQQQQQPPQQQQAQSMQEQQARQQQAMQQQQALQQQQSSGVQNMGNQQPLGQTTIGNGQYDMQDFKDFANNPVQGAKDYWKGNSAGDMAMDASMFVPGLGAAGALARGGVKAAQLYSKSGKAAKAAKFAKNRLLNKPMRNSKDTSLFNPLGKRSVNHGKKLYTDKISGAKASALGGGALFGAGMAANGMQEDVLPGQGTSQGNIPGMGDAMLNPRPDGTQGPLNQQGVFDKSDKLGGGFDPEAMKKVAKGGKDKDSIWDKIQSKDYWMKGIEGGSGDWDNRLYRMGEILQRYGAMPGSKGANPSERWSAANTANNKAKAAANKPDTASFWKTVSASDMNENTLLKLFTPESGGIFGDSKQEATTQGAARVAAYISKRAELISMSQGGKVPTHQDVMNALEGKKKKDK